MTNQHQPPSQNLNLNNLNDGREVEQSSTSSSSSSSGHIFRSCYPKQAKYLQIWEPDILLSYYQKTPTLTSNDSERYKFLQKKIAIFFGFFFMLRPFKTYQTKILNNPEYESNPQSGFW
jgi:hypothetical protein